MKLGDGFDPEAGVGWPSWRFSSSRMTSSARPLRSYHPPAHGDQFNPSSFVSSPTVQLAEAVLVVAGLEQGHHFMTRSPSRPGSRISSWLTSSSVMAGAPKRRASSARHRRIRFDSLRQRRRRSRSASAVLPSRRFGGILWVQHQQLIASRNGVRVMARLVSKRRHQLSTSVADRFRCPSRHAESPASTCRIARNPAHLGAVLCCERFIEHRLQALPAVRQRACHHARSVPHDAFVVRLARPSATAGLPVPFRHAAPVRTAECERATGDRPARPSLISFASSLALSSRPNAAAAYA